MRDQPCLRAATAGKLTGRQLWDKTIKEADWALFGGDADGEDGEDVDYEFAENSDDENGGYEFDDDEDDDGDEEEPADEAAA